MTNTIKMYVHFLENNIILLDITVYINVKHNQTSKNNTIVVFGVFNCE